MADLKAKVLDAASRIEGVDPGSVEIGPVYLEAGAITRVAPYLQESKLSRIIIAADANTYEVAGKTLEQLVIQSGISVKVTLIQPDLLGDVKADEAALIQLILDLKMYSAEAVIAVGSGTLHDITRFSAYTLSIPFISVPTAPSVDGFNSKGAPLILRGEKKTIQTIGPSAIFADLDILTQAPTAMVAAGFGDMLGKFTSLFDWRFGSLTGGEPYSPVVAEMTRSALQLCVQHIDEIASRSPEGIRLLTGALLESGFAMLLFGHSHPASGAEHHLSHYWEMEFIRSGQRQILHGAKVGVACAEISALYHRLAEEWLPSAYPTKLEEILGEIQQIPNEFEIRRLLKIVGGPTTVDELGVDEQLLVRSLSEAHYIRFNRFTLLRAYNEKHKA
jgi:glycerol-1-phosphate dehydrogenase [NAD(P)+]